MKPTTRVAALQKLAGWRDRRAWVDCQVQGHESFGYRVVGLVDDFDDGFIVGSNADRCATTLPLMLLQHCDLIEIDAAGALHVRFPHTTIMISEIARVAGHA